MLTHKPVTKEVRVYASPEMNDALDDISRFIYPKLDEFSNVDQVAIISYLLADLVNYQSLIMRLSFNDLGVDAYEHRES